MLLPRAGRKPTVHIRKEKRKPKPKGIRAPAGSCRWPFPGTVRCFDTGDVPKHIPQRCLSDSYCIQQIFLSVCLSVCLSVKIVGDLHIHVNSSLYRNIESSRPYGVAASAGVCNVLSGGTAASSRHTAWQDIPSPVPVKPSFSSVVAFTFTRSGATPTAAAMFSCI